MLAERLLDKIPASRERSDALLGQARGFTRSARVLLDSDPTAAFVLTYDAARLALTAILENQGLRPTTKGGHLAVIDAVMAQLDPPLGVVFRPVNRLRLRRNRLEYPSAAEPTVHAAEVAEALTSVDAVIAAALTVLDVMPPWA